MKKRLKKLLNTLISKKYLFLLFVSIVFLSTDKISGMEYLIFAAAIIGIHGLEKKFVGTYQTEGE